MRCPACVPLIVLLGCGTPPSESGAGSTTLAETSSDAGSTTGAAGSGDSADTSSTGTPTDTTGGGEDSSGTGDGSGDDSEEFHARRAWINETISVNPQREARLAEINLDPENLEVQAALRDIVCTLDNQAVPLGVYAVGAHRESFDPELVVEMKNCLKDWRELDGHGTENHALMQNSAGYLFTQWFPGEEGWLTNGDKRVSSEALHAELREKLLTVLSSLYDKGYVENLSTTYDHLHIFPILALREFAEDEDVALAAEAALLFHFANIASNVLHGLTIAPFNRANYAQVNALHTGSQPNTQFMHWLYWPEGTNFTNIEEYWNSHPHNWPVVYNATVGWRPPDIIRRVATGTESPSWARSSAPTFGNWGTGTSHDHMRRVYRAEDFAIGTGFFRYKPTEYYTDFKNFMIAYRTEDKYSYIETSHNYWRSDEDGIDDERTWTKCSNSPFQQVTHHENTVIALYDIPESDPWVGVGRSDWQELRDGHSGALIHRVDTRFPKAVDEQIELDGWIFLREADVYIGIRPLQSYTIDRSTLPDFDIIRSEGAQNGTIFEVGTRDTHGDFPSFWESLTNNPIESDLGTVTVTYTDSEGDTLSAAWAPVDYTQTTADDRVLVRPTTTVNGVQEPGFAAEDWPVLDGGSVSLIDRILTVSEGGETLTVDWSGEHPVITGG